MINKVERILVEEHQTDLNTNLELINIHREEQKIENEVEVSKGMLNCNSGFVPLEILIRYTVECSLDWMPVLEGAFILIII